MTRGNQRELARAKNLKKQQKDKKTGDQTGNKGVSLEERRHRDAEKMREKQKKKEDAAEAAGGATGGKK